MLVPRKLPGIREALLMSPTTICDVPPMEQGGGPGMGGESSPLNHGWSLSGGSYTSVSMQ